MAIAHVQSSAVTGTGATTSVARAFSGLVAAGNLIVVAVSWGSASVVESCTVSDNLGNTYTRLTNCDQVDATNQQQIAVFYAKNVVGGSCTVTATFAGSRDNNGIVIAEYSGVDTTAPADQSVGNFQTAPGTGANAVTSTAKTTTQAGELAVGAYADTSVGAGTTITAGTGFTKRQDTGGGGAHSIQIVLEDQIQSSAGSIAATFTEALNHRALSAMATFAAGAVSGAPMAVQSSRIMLMGASGAVTTAPTPPPPSFPVGRYGGATGFHIMSGALTTAQMQAQVAHWAADGCQTLRYDALDTPDYLARFDVVLAACEANGMDTICCLRGTSGPMSSDAAVQDFVHRTTQRWGTRIAIWEWVNEPNLPNGASTNPPRYTAAQYGHELSVAYAALKTELPGCIVMNGGLGLWAGSGATYPPNWWPIALANGASGHFDYFNSHAYDDPITGGNWNIMCSLDNEGKDRIMTEAGSSGPGSVITNAMTDSRAKCVCIYTMYTDESATWAIFGNAREVAYKGVTGAP